MTQRATLAAHVHIEGFDQFHRDAFNKRQVRAAFRKAGQLVRQRAQLNLALALGGTLGVRNRAEPGSDDAGEKNGAQGVSATLFLPQGDASAG